MDTCVATTKKGEECKNKVSEGILCHIHKSGKPEVKPKPAMVYNPYYEKYISAFGEENCGKDRSSLSRMKKTYKNYKFVESYCDVLPLKYIKYVVGPIKYSEYQYGNYNIGVFGEVHGIPDIPQGIDAKSTLNFSSFLESIVTQNPKQFDFFLETEFITHERKAGRTHSANTIFHLLSIDFKQCLSVIKKCPYKNLRAHYVDYRSMTDLDSNPVSKLYDDVTAYVLSDKSKDIYEYVNLEETTKIMSSAYDYYYETRDKVNKMIDTDPKIRKQLDNNPLKNDILEFIKVLEDRNLKEYYRYLERIPEMQSEGQPEHTILLNFANFFIQLYGFVMDVYTLGRMFRTFGKTPLDDPKNIIVYAGDGHSKVYREFLAYIKAKKILEIKQRTPSDFYIEFSESDKRKSFLFNTGV